MQAGQKDRAKLDRMRIAQKHRSVITRIDIGLDALDGFDARRGGADSGSFSVRPVEIVFARQPHDYLGD